MLETENDRYVVEVARPDIGYNHPKFGGWVIAHDSNGEPVPASDKTTASKMDDELTRKFPNQRYRIRKIDGPAHT